MQVNFYSSPNFCRRLKASEEAEYCDVLKRGKNYISGTNGKSVLIIPASSLPQGLGEETGVGNLASTEGQKFFEFAKKYWDINEIQILPIGQYFEYKGGFPIYSGTAMDLGNHVINSKDFLSEEEFKKIVDSNTNRKSVNFENIVKMNSPQEKALKNLYTQMSNKMKEDFNNFKIENKAFLEPKGIYKALSEVYGTNIYKTWDKVDANLFDDRIVSAHQRDQRIREIYGKKGETIDFYLFKQFLAQKSLQKAKLELNKKGIKLSGDMPCGFSYDEIWANPKAFMQNTTICWGLPALDVESPEAEKVLRQKVREYSKNFDGFRVDASWTYITPKLTNTLNESYSRKDYGSKLLDIIDDEARNVKGKDFDVRNITHEFSADSADFNIYDGDKLNPVVKDRIKIYTSDWLDENWGSSKNFKKRGWGDSYILGATNHDSKAITITEKQAHTLSDILKIPYEKLLDYKEFVKAKLAEPLGSHNNMIFFMQALGLKGQFSNNRNHSENYRIKIPENYEDFYFTSLQNGEAFNPMDALEKQFKSKGLDKTNPKLFRKIVKYRKILEKKEGHKFFNNQIVLIGAIVLGLAGLLAFYLKTRTNLEKNNK